MLNKYWAGTALLGLLLASPAAWAGTWEVTVAPTNTKSSSASSTEAAGVGLSSSTSATLIASAGQTTSSVTAQGHAAYSGTWTFHWVPDNSTDWPTDYTVTSIKTRIYKSIANNGTGTAKIYVTGGADLAKVDTSVTVSPSNTPPSTTTTTDTSVSNLSVVTKTITSHSSKAVSTTGWMETAMSIVSSERSYSAAYFTSNFSTPGAVTLTFTVESVDLSADLSFSGTATDSVGAAVAAASEIYRGVSP